MEMKTVVVVQGMKESKGNFEGKDFSSTVFHCVVDLAENGAGRSMGVVTRPFKIKDAGEFEKWAHLKNSFPVQAEAVFSIAASKEDGAALTLLSIVPVQRQAPQPKQG